MVPLSDMFNHAETHQCSWGYDNHRQGFVMTADTDIPKDTEIFDSYGEKSSYQFLMHYAFIFAGDDGFNKKDEFSITLDLNWKDPLYDQKYKEYISDESETSFEFKIVPEIGKKGVMYDLLAFARFVTFQGEPSALDELADKAYRRAVETMEKEEKSLKEYVGNIFEEPFDLLTESSAWYLILWTVEDALRMYPTTLQEDLEILEKDEQDPKLTYNEKNCILLRRNDKIVLESVKETAFNILELANLSHRDALNMIMKKRKEFKSSMKYV